MRRKEARSDGRLPKGEVVRERAVAAGPFEGSWMGGGSIGQEGLYEQGAVGGCDIRETSDLLVHADFIKPDKFFRRETPSNKGVHEEHIVVPLCLDQSHGSLEGKVRRVEVAPSVFDPTRSCEVVPRIIVKLPERSCRAKFQG